MVAAQKEGITSPTSTITTHTDSLCNTPLLLTKFFLDMCTPGRSYSTANQITSALALYYASNSMPPEMWVTNTPLVKQPSKLPKSRAGQAKSDSPSELTLLIP